MFLTKWLFPQRWREKNLLSDDFCNELTAFLSDKEGNLLHYRRDVDMTGASVYITSDNRTTALTLHVAEKDLGISRIELARALPVVYSQVLRRIEKAAKQSGLKRIIVWDLREDAFCSSLRAAGYCPGLCTDDYRKLVK